jgi:hypothetical protein
MTEEQLESLLLKLCAMPVISDAEFRRLAAGLFIIHEHPELYPPQFAEAE